MKNLERHLREIENELTAKLEKANQMLENVPSGELRIKRHRGTIHYYNKTKKDGRTAHVYIRDCEKDYMLDKDHYIGTNYDRIAKYASAGILIGENLIITGETKDKPLSTKTIKRIIDAYCR